MQDEKLIELFFDRSERAISETSRKYGAYCSSIAYSILRDRRDCEEVTQDALMNLWDSIPPARPRSLKAYLGRIVRNLSLGVYEKNSARKRGGGETALVLEELSEVLPGENSTEHIAEQHDLSGLLNTFLGTLEETDRRAFVRRYWYMSPVKDIARDLGLRESAVKMKLKRTRDKLRTILEQEGHGEW